MFGKCGLENTHKKIEALNDKIFELQGTVAGLSSRLKTLENPIIGEFYYPVSSWRFWHCFRQSDVVDQTDTEIKLPLSTLYFSGTCPTWIKKCNVVFYDTKQKGIEKLKVAVVKKNKIVQKNKE